MRAAILAEEARRSGSRSFAAFVKQAWQYVPQVEPLVWGWHMDAICLHAEAVARAEINWLGIAMPPGMAKSVFTSVLWPAWIWTWWPRCQFMFGSYSHDFVVRDARRCREVLQSQWYRETYSGPGDWALREDFGSATSFWNTAGGVRLATSPRGQGAGQRAHIIGIDDPINIIDAHSDAVRDEAIEWISQTLSQRWVAGYAARFMLVMQRLDERDPMAWVGAQRGAQILRLPMLFEPEARCETVRRIQRNGTLEEVRWHDPRARRDELLFPALFPLERVQDARDKLGDFGFAAQMQQRPAPASGGLFKYADWRFWKPDKDAREKLGYDDHDRRPRGCVQATGDGAVPGALTSLAEIEDLTISVDATFRETESGSYVAIHVWGCVGKRRLLVYRVHRRMDFTDTVAALLEVIRLFPDARRKLIEGKANGDAIISTLEKTHHVIGIEAINPGKQSKEQRAHAMQPYVSAHNVELPDGAPWLEEYVAEHAAFPKGAHEDDVDCQSQALYGIEQKVKAASFGDEKWRPPRRTF